MLLQRGRHRKQEEGWHNGAGSPWWLSFLATASRLDIHNRLHPLRWQPAPYMPGNWQECLRTQDKKRPGWMWTEILRMKIWLHKHLAEVQVVATAAAPSKFSIYIQQPTDGGEEMYEWRSRSNVALPVELKSAGRLHLREHISFSMHKILQGLCLCNAGHTTSLPHSITRGHPQNQKWSLDFQPQSRVAVFMHAKPRSGTHNRAGKSRLSVRKTISFLYFFSSLFSLAEMFLTFTRVESLFPATRWLLSLSSSWFTKCKTQDIHFCSSVPIMIQQIWWNQAHQLISQS